MGEIKSAFEKAMERLSSIEDATAEEKALMKDRDRVKELLASFFRGETSRDQLWAGLKGTGSEILREAQLRIIDSLRLGSLPVDMKMREAGILAIESLKERPNAAAVEGILKSIDGLQSEFTVRREEAIREIREAVEQNPQLRTRPVRTPDGRTAMQASLTVDEAVRARVSEYLPQLETQYEKAFLTMTERLRGEIAPTR